MGNTKPHNNPHGTANTTRLTKSQQNTEDTEHDDTKLHNTKQKQTKEQTLGCASFVARYLLTSVIKSTQHKTTQYPIRTTKSQTKPNNAKQAQQNIVLLEKANKLQKQTAEGVAQTTTTKTRVKQVAFNEKTHKLKYNNQQQTTRTQTTKTNHIEKQNKHTETQNRQRLLVIAFIASLVLKLSHNAAWTSSCACSSFACNFLSVSSHACCVLPTSPTPQKTHESEYE